VDFHLLSFASLSWRSPFLAEFVEKVGAGANFWCPLLERADISLPPQFLLRRFGFLGLWR
jgi:hypothetical protein